MKTNVKEIRRRAGEGEMHKNLATEFKVARNTISDIVTGERWKPQSVVVKLPNF